VIIEVPTATPVGIPLNDPIVAMAVLLLVHIPPGTLLPNKPVCPTHKLVEPVMAVGVELTVIVVVTKQAPPTV
jgi:hypothetical protein